MSLNALDNNLKTLAQTVDDLEATSASIMGMLGLSLPTPGPGNVSTMAPTTLGQLMDRIAAVDDRCRAVRADLRSIAGELEGADRIAPPGIVGAEVAR